MPLDNREYSPQSTEIFGKLPHWIIRWGMSVIFLIFAGLIAGSYLMKYPQIVVAPIIITKISQPNDPPQIVGMMEVTSAGYGRVAVGQTVNVKLNGFPYFEYGLLKGVVNRISSVPEKEGYIVEVTFPNGLQSTYKAQLQLIQRMDGTADIITRNQRLIQRFIQPLRAFFDR